MVVAAEGALVMVAVVTEVTVIRDTESLRRRNRRILTPLKCREEDGWFRRVVDGWKLEVS